MIKARLLTLPLLLALAACGQPDQKTAPEPPLAGAAIGGPFELTDTKGKLVRWDDFSGKYRIVYFGYAYCPDVCPFDVQRIAQAHALFVESHPEFAGQLQPVFITIDPERDTPEVVGEFLANFSDDIVGLTGTREQVDAAAKAFGVYFARGEDSPGGGYLMDHSRAAYLMGRDGEPIALLPVEETKEAIVTELEKWVH